MNGRVQRHRVVFWWHSQCRLYDPLVDAESFGVPLGHSGHALRSCIFRVWADSHVWFAFFGDVLRNLILAKKNGSWGDWSLGHIAFWTKWNTGLCINKTTACFKPRPGLDRQRSVNCHSLSKHQRREIDVKVIWWTFGDFLNCFLKGKVIVGIKVHVIELTDYKCIPDVTTDFLVLNHDPFRRTTKFS